MCLLTLFMANQGENIFLLKYIYIKNFIFESFCQIGRLKRCSTGLQMPEVAQMDGEGK